MGRQGNFGTKRHHLLAAPACLAKDFGMGHASLRGEGVWSQGAGHGPISMRDYQSREGAKGAELWQV